MLLIEIYPHILLFLVFVVLNKPFFKKKIVTVSQKSL